MRLRCVWSAFDMRFKCVLVCFEARLNCVCDAFQMRFNGVLRLVWGAFELRFKCVLMVFWSAFEVCLKCTRNAFEARSRRLEVRLKRVWNAFEVRLRWASRGHLKPKMCQKCDTVLTNEVVHFPRQNPHAQGAHPLETLKAYWNSKLYQLLGNKELLRSYRWWIYAGPWRVSNPLWRQEGMQET